MCIFPKKEIERIVKFYFSFSNAQGVLKSKSLVSPEAQVSEFSRIGTRNIICPFVTIGPNVIIGNGNIILPGVRIGSPSRERWFGRAANKPLIKNSGIVIGNNNLFEDNAVVQAGLGRGTQVGCNVAIGPNAIVSHDCHLHDGVILNGAANIGGHCTIMERAYIGMNSAIHQRTVVGEMALVGMGSTLLNCLAPLAKAVGSPASFVGQNSIGIYRSKETPNSVSVDVDLSNQEYDDYLNLESHAYKNFLTEIEKIQHPTTPVIGNKYFDE